MKEKKGKGLINEQGTRGRLGCPFKVCSSGLIRDPERNIKK